MAYHVADPNAFDNPHRTGHGSARGETMRLKIRASMTLILCLTALCWMAESAGAQFLQYTPPGGPREQPESRQEQLARELREARYHLGPVRLAPWATLRDVAYVRSIVAAGAKTPNDLTATAGAGFRAYLRNGPKATWSAQVLPEYVWWRRQPERRQLNGRYLLGFSGFFNHLTVELKAGRQQQLQIVTPEVPVPVSSRSDGGELLAELRITSALSAFAAVALSRQHNVVEGTRDPLTGELRLLDRDERMVRTGLRWRPSAPWTVGLGVERSETDFLRGELDRSNSGTAPVAEVRYQGRRIGFQADVADRSLRASQGSEFVPYDGVTGSAALALQPRRRLGGSLYASRNLEYSIAPAYAYLLDERLGVALNLNFGQRTQSRLFVEGGSNDYTPFAGAQPRHEQVSSYGGSLTFDLGHGLALGLQGVRSRFGSNSAAGDRTYTSVGATINLTGLP
jgi:hypothetical protein